MSRDIDREMAPPQHEAIICSGSLRQRDPDIFTGSDDIDAEDWLSSYERVSAYNRWDDDTKWKNVYFSLRDSAEKWLRNHEATIRDWSTFKVHFMEAFGRSDVRKLRAEQRLSVRAQLENETYTSYIEDVVDLCNRVNPAMPESEKIKHVLKGIEDYAFQMLLGKNPQTVREVLNWCLSYDELRKQRVFTRQRKLPKDDFAREGSLSSLSMPSDMSSLLPHIKEFVREEVARQLALLPSAQEPVSSLPSTVRHVIREQVAEALPSVRQPALVPAPLAAPMAPPFPSPVAAPIAPPVAAPLEPQVAVPFVSPGEVPLTYASVVRRLQPGALQSYQYAPDQRAMTYLGRHLNR